MANQNLPGGRAYYTGKNAYASQAFELDTRRELQTLRDQLTTLQNALSAVNAAAVPSGAISAFAGATAPSGWVLCDGSSLLRSVYPNLFTAIGTTWGSVDALHFTVPDLRGRTTIGAGTGSGLTTRTLATTGGEETHQLTTAELASHTHGLTQLVSNIAGTVSGGGAINAQTNRTAITQTTDSAGSNTPHNNMQPFAVTNWIIKT